MSINPVGDVLRGECSWALARGDYREALASVEMVDALITDPPYGARTHAGHDSGVERVENHEHGDTKTSRRRRLHYSCWTRDDVWQFVEFWSPRVRGWFGAMSCSDLAGVWREAFEYHGRVAFAPVACVIRAMSVRLSGDGPSNWVVYLNLARPKGLIDGTRNGAYVVNRDAGHIAEWSVVPSPAHGSQMRSPGRL